MGTYTGGNHPVYSGSGVIPLSVSLTAATTNGAAGVASIANPLGVDLIIINAYLDITTAATTPANTIDAGIAANGTTSSDTLFDGQGTTAGLKSPGGTNGGLPRKWGAAQYVTATASATLAGLVGTIHFVCVRA